MPTIIVMFKLLKGISVFEKGSNLLMGIVICRIGNDCKHSIIKEIIEEIFWLSTFSIQVKPRGPYKWSLIRNFIEVRFFSTVINIFCQDNISIIALNGSFFFWASSTKVSRNNPLNYIPVYCVIYRLILSIFSIYEIKAKRPEPYQNVCKRFAHDQSSWVVTGAKKIQELI